MGGRFSYWKVTCKHLSHYICCVLRWHFVTISITPPKRPFSYSQINVYVDFIQKLSATLKAQPFNEVDFLFSFSNNQKISHKFRFNHSHSLIVQLVQHFKIQGPPLPIDIIMQRPMIVHQKACCRILSKGHSSRK